MSSKSYNHIFVNDFFEKNKIRKWVVDATNILQLILIFNIQCFHFTAFLIVIFAAVKL